MKFFTQNIGLKFIALLGAVVLWAYVTISKSRVSYFPGSLPIEVRNTSSGLAAIYDEQKVRVRLQAPYEVWNQLGIDNLKASIDLAGLDEGTHEIDVNVKVNLPKVIVIEKEPSTMMIRLEAVVQKEVPIKVIFAGETREGFVTGEPKVRPDRVKVEGARSLIDDISQAVVRIKLAGEYRDFQRRVPLFFDDGANARQTKIRFIPRSVDTFVTFAPASGSKIVGVKVKTKGRPRPDYYVSKIESTPAVVEIFSTAGALPSILNIETEEIDIQGLKKNLEKEAALSIPAKSTLKEKKVRVRIILAPNVVERQITASYHYKLSSGFRVISIEPVKVVVSGPTNIINSLVPSKVIVTFNLTEKEPGTHLVNITQDMVFVPGDYILVSWLPSAVVIVLEKYE